MLSLVFLDKVYGCFPLMYIGWLCFRSSYEIEFFNCIICDSIFNGEPLELYLVVVWCGKTCVKPSRVSFVHVTVF